MPAKRTEPSRSLLDQASGFKYTPAARTDLAKRFADMRRAAAKAEREAAAAAMAARQTGLDLDLELPAAAGRVIPLKSAHA